MDEVRRRQRKECGRQQRQTLALEQACGNQIDQPDIDRRNDDGRKSSAPFRHPDHRHHEQGEVHRQRRSPHVAAHVKVEWQATAVEVATGLTRWMRLGGRWRFRAHASPRARRRADVRTARRPLRQPAAAREPVSTFSCARWMGPEQADTVPSHCHRERARKPPPARAARATDTRQAVIARPTNSPTSPPQGDRAAQAMPRDGRGRGCVVGR